MFQSVEDVVDRFGVKGNCLVTTFERFNFPVRANSRSNGISVAK